MLASFSDKVLNISGAEACCCLIIERCMYFSSRNTIYNKGFIWFNASNLASAMSYGI
jgi:hypothetical protein